MGEDLVDSAVGAVAKSFDEEVELFVKENAKLDRANVIRLFEQRQKRNLGYLTSIGYIVFLIVWVLNFNRRLVGDDVGVETMNQVVDGGGEINMFEVESQLDMLNYIETIGTAFTTSRDTRVNSAVPPTVDYITPSVGRSELLSGFPVFLKRTEMVQCEQSFLRSIFSGHRCLAGNVEQPPLWCINNSTLCMPWNGATDGYTIFFPNDLTNAEFVTQFDWLKSNFVIDTMSREVSAMMLIYNTNWDVLVLLTMTWTITAAGKWDGSLNLQVIDGNTDVGGLTGFLLFGPPILLGMMTFVSAIQLVRGHQKRKIYDKKSFVTRLIENFSLVAVALRVTIVVYVHAVMKVRTMVINQYDSMQQLGLDPAISPFSKAMSPPIVQEGITFYTFSDLHFTFVEMFDELFGWQNTTVLAGTAVSVLAFVRFFSTINVLGKLALFSRTITVALVDVAHFMIVFALFLFAFAGFGMGLFFYTTAEFNGGIGQAFETLFLWLFGDFDFQSGKQIAPIAFPMFFYVFCVSGVLVLTNMFVAIIMDAYAAISAQSVYQKSLGEDAAELCKLAASRIAIARGLEKSKPSDDDVWIWLMTETNDESHAVLVASEIRRNHAEGKHKHVAEAVAEMIETVWSDEYAQNGLQMTVASKLGPFGHSSNFQGSQQSELMRQFYRSARMVLHKRKGMALPDRLNEFMRKAFADAVGQKLPSSEFSPFIENQLDVYAMTNRHRFQQNGNMNATVPMTPTQVSLPTSPSFEDYTRQQQFQNEKDFPQGRNQLANQVVHGSLENKIDGLVAATAMMEQTMAIMAQRLTNVETKLENVLSLDRGGDDFGHIDLEHDLKMLRNSHPPSVNNPSHKEPQRPKNQRENFEDVYHQVVQEFQREGRAIRQVSSEELYRKCVVLEHMTTKEWKQFITASLSQ